MYILYKLNLPLTAYFLIYGLTASGLSMFYVFFKFFFHVSKPYLIQNHIVIVPKFWLT